MTVVDPNYPSRHRLENSRFNFQSRDDYIDLLARDKWRSVRYDRYVGDLNLICPTLNRVPRILPVRVIASWEEPFVVVEFKLGEDFCQVCTRPRFGARGWKRVDSESFIPRGPASYEPSTVWPDDLPGQPNLADPSSSSNAVEVEVLERPAFRSFIESAEPSEGRETDTESCHDLSIVSSASEASPRNLSSVATLTTYAGGDAHADYHADYPFEIDFERVENTPIDWAESFFICRGK